jgi:serine/threonine protein kinase
MHGVVRQTTKLQRKIASLAAFERQHDGVGDSPAQAPARSPARGAGAVAPPSAPAAPPSIASAPKASKYRNPHFREQVRSERAAVEWSAAVAATSGGGSAKRPAATVALPAAARDDNCQATAVLLTKLQETIAQGVRFELEALGGEGGAAAWPGAAASIIEGHFTDLDGGSAPNASPARVSSAVVALQMIANNERGRLERTRAMWQSLLPQLLALQREGEAQRSARARGSAFSTLHANVDAWMSADWLINESLLEFGAHLGNGAFGTVSQGNMGGAPVAIKKFHVDLKGPKHDQLVNDFLSEAHTMSRLPPHPNVVQFIGACVSPDKWGLCLVMEFLPRGDLRTLLFGDASISFGERMRLAMEVATGVHALHSLTPPMLHRDLKSSNVCIDERMQAKVCDFGLSRFKSKRQEQDETGADSMPVGTAMWMAPELIAVAQGAVAAGDGGDPFSEKSDVFAIGILIWQLVVRAEPYSGLSLSAIMFQVVSDGLRPVVPCRLGAGADPAPMRVALASAEPSGASASLSLPEPVARLMQACWDEDPERRPDLSSVIQDLARWAS